MRPAQTALVSAALRHVRDAEALLPASPDQAWHLAGFGPECIRKACLSDRMFHKLLGHSWTPESEALLEHAVSMDGQAWRYRLDGWATAEPLLAQWLPDHRYDRTGAHAQQAADLVSACRRLVDRVHGELWMDGLLARVEA